MNSDEIPLVINPRTGEQHPCPGCEEREAIIARNERRAHARERNLERLLREAIEGIVDDSPEREQAETIFAYWVFRCAKRKNTEFTDERRKAVYSRLRGRQTFDDILCAIDGAGTFPTVDDKSGKPYNDLELICRNGSKFDSFLERGQRARDDEDHRLEQQTIRVNRLTDPDDTFAHEFIPDPPLAKVLELFPQPAGEEVEAA